MVLCRAPRFAFHCEDGCEMADAAKWQLLVVDDDCEICQEVQEFLGRETITELDGCPEVQTLIDFDEALPMLATRRFDLLILDVREGSHSDKREEEKGTETLKDIRQRCFIPVVFYTGLPGQVSHLESPFVKIAEKTDGLPSLLEKIKAIFETRLPTVNRALIRHMETVQRDYMWTFVAENWDEFGGTPDRASLAYLLARRLAMSLSDTGIQELIQEMGAAPGGPVAEDRVHPMRYYITPPLKPSPLAGDLYQGRIKNQDGYWVLLTPSCDLVQQKADRILLARCEILTEQHEYKEWKAELPSPARVKENRLMALLQNNRQVGQRDRFHVLPGVLDLPDLVVDFQQLVTLPLDQLAGLKQRASLDSPFAQELVTRFSRYFGRLGTPDLDVEGVMARLRSS